MRDLKVGDPGQYSKEELQAMLDGMTTVSAGFYAQATRIGCHGFIEFTGLMNEYIKVCEQSVQAGVDFAMSNTHSGVPLVVHDYNIAYLAEKLDCILGPILNQDAKTQTIFLDSMGLPAVHVVEYNKVVKMLMDEKTALQAEVDKLKAKIKRHPKKKKKPMVRRSA